MKNSTYRAQSLCTMLGVLFVGLKLAGFIDWSWWLVLLPFFVPLAIIAACALLVGGIEIYDKLRENE